MTTTVSVTSLEVDVRTAMQSFLLGIVFPGTEVVRGQVNRVPIPTSPDYVVVTIMGRVRLNTTVASYLDDGVEIVPATNPPTYTPGTQYFAQAVQLTVQLDVHGPNSGDNAAIITTLFRSEYGCEQFATANVPMQPLYTSDPRQLSFTASDEQYEDRWSIDAVLQVTPIVSTPQYFAHQIVVPLVEVDGEFPPGA